MSASDMIEKLPPTLSPLYTIEVAMLFTFRSEDCITSTLAGLNSLASLPEVAYLHAGPVLRARNFWPETEAFTHLLHARFPSIRAFQLFRNHPEFVRVVGEMVMAKVTDIVTVEWFWAPNFGPMIPPPGQTVNLSLFKLKGDRERRWVGKHCLYDGILEMKRMHGGCPVVKPLTFGTELWELAESGKPYSVGVATVIGKSKKMKFDCLTTVFGEINEREFDYLMKILMLDVERAAGVYGTGIGIDKVVSIDYAVPVAEKSKLNLNAIVNVLLPLFCLVGVSVMMKMR